MRSSESITEPARLCRRLKRFGSRAAHGRAGASWNAAALCRFASASSALLVFIVAISTVAAPIWPGNEWPTASPREMGLDEAKLIQARDYALTAEGSGMVVRSGKVVMTWGDQKQRYDLKSTTKSFGATALGIAIFDNKMRLDDKALKYHPTLGTPPETNVATGWIGEITIRHLASQTAGFEKPGGYTPLLFRPGTKWDYSDSGPNWLAECITLAYARDLNDLMFERLFTPIGIQKSDLVWRKNSYRPALIEGIMRREFGAGISANVDAMARFGYLHLRGGDWNGNQILPRTFIDELRRPQAPNLAVRKPEEYGHASQHYGLLWWNNADATLPNVPRDAFWSWGLYDSLIVVIPSLDIVVARAGKSWPREKNAAHYDPLRPFLEPIALAAKANARQQAALAFPPSSVIKEIHWAPTNTIIRLAKGSDNWPMTWADDDALYTAYGDGNGFQPQLHEKLSLGLAKLIGTPSKITGLNLRSPSAESKGEGKSGRKASGILMVDGVLYLLVRNVGNAQLGWSHDHGITWQWAEWKFTTSFGCPTFLNFGRDYAGARDEFVYIYSHDSDSAYDHADRMVLARVPKNRLRQREAYQFFQKLDQRDQPVWTNDIQQRGAVFTDPAKCYRSAISYHPGLKRYLWCQTGLGADTRFAGGFAIYDAPEPWGPWSTAYTTSEWDVGPGETSSIPTKWINEEDGSFYLVFSGNDSFSLRKAAIQQFHK